MHFVNGVVFSAGLPASVAVECDGRGMTIDAQRLILATGAFERPLPVPGWTLPGVMTRGSTNIAQKLWGGGGSADVDRRQWPLNLQVAVELHRAGAAIVAMVEAAPPPGLGNLASLGRMAVNAPDLMLDGIGYVAALRWSQIPVIHGAAIDRIDAGERLAVTLTNGQRYRADVVCMGYGFLPSNELARLLGCRHHYDAAHGFRGRPAIRMAGPASTPSSPSAMEPALAVRAPPRRRGHCRTCRCNRHRRATIGCRAGE